MTSPLLSLIRVIDLIPTPCVLVDLDARIIHVNPANDRLLFGRTADELRGKPAADVLPPEFGERMPALLGSVLARGQLRGVFPTIRSDGSIAHIEVFANLVRSPAGKPQAILATVRDLEPEVALLEQLSASALSLASASDDDFLPTVVRAAREFLAARYAALAIVDGGHLLRFIPDGLSSDEISAIGHGPEGHGLLGAMISEQRTIRVADISADPRASGFPHGHPTMRSFLGTPVRTADELLGHLYFTDKRDADGFSLLDERLAELFAVHAALAIVEARHRASLEASQRHLARAQRIAGLGSWEREVATDRLHWSDESHRLFGLEPGTFDGSLLAFLAFVHPADRESAIVDYRSVERGRAPRDYRIIRADGTERTMHEEAEAVRDETGAIVRYVGTTQDITDRVAAEAERTRLEEGLRQSERSLSEAQGVAHIGSWEWDLATGTARRSQELHRIFGLAPGTMPATPTAFLAFVHPGDRARVEASVQAAIAGTGRHDLDFRVIRPDGEVRTVHEVGEAVRDEQGAAVRLVGTVVDLTERVAAASERARLISAVEQTADSIMITETDGTIAYVNPSFTRLYGYQPEEVVGLRQAVLDSGHQEPSFWPELWASVSAGRTWSGPIVNRAKDGADVRVDAVISSIRDASGKVTSYVQADRDVTHERELERTVERDARNREVIAAALERIDSGSSPDEIAAAACAEIIRLPDIDSAVVFDLTPGSEVLLAAAGRIAVALGPTIAVPQARSKYLRDRARAGPWIEQWREGGEDESFGELARSGLDGVAYAPFRGPGDTIGLIGVGASGAFAAGQLVERLSTLVTFGSIVGALIGPALGARHRGEAERARIRTTIDGAAFRPVFQPIVDLRDGSVVGYEALTRFDDGERPDLVFEAATRAGLGIDLEAACLLAAVRAARLLRTTTYLSLNVSPEFILSGGLKPILSGLPRQVVLEVTEHVAIDDYAALRRSLTGLGPTVRVAVDDAGAGYASFRHILELAPNFVKIDIGLVRGVDAEPARQALIAGMGYFAVRRKLHLIAEGIETVAELGALRALAVPYGQGFLLGRPRPSRGSGRWPTRIDLRPPAST